MQDRPGGKKSVNAIAQRIDTEKKEGTSLTYDTALQVVSRATEKDLLLLDDLLGRHLLALLLAGIGTADKKRRGEKRGSGLLAAVFQVRGKSRTSCRTFKAEGERKEEKSGELEGRRGDGGHTGPALKAKEWRGRGGGARAASGGVLVVVCERCARESWLVGGSAPPAVFPSPHVTPVP